MHTLYIFLCGTSGLSVALGCFLCGQAWLNDLCFNINSLNDNAKFGGNPIQMIEQISDIIETHSAVFKLSGQCLILFNSNSIMNIFRLFDEFLKTAQLIMFTFFAWCFVVICAALLLFQMEIVEFLFHFN